MEVVCLVKPTASRYALLIVPPPVLFFYRCNQAAALFRTADNPDALSSLRKLKQVTLGPLSAANSCGDRPCRAAAGLVWLWSASSDRRGTWDVFK